MNTWFTEGWDPLKEANYKKVSLRAKRAEKKEEEEEKEEDKKKKTETEEDRK
jgi:hypothetical protein